MGARPKRLARHAIEQKGDRTMAFAGDCAGDAASMPMSASRTKRTSLELQTPHPSGELGNAAVVRGCGPGSPTAGIALRAGEPPVYDGC